MASVEIARLARDDLGELIKTRSLPADTGERAWRSLLRLEQFPRAGKQLAGAWNNYRALIGPWGWMIAIYTYVERDDQVVVVACPGSPTQAGGSASADPG